MKEYLRDISIDMVIDEGIFKINLLSCSILRTFLRKTSGLSDDLKEGSVFTVNLSYL